ncbi:MAG: nicotinate-nucleotide--dimethylbenzimidazole phosphoribosyltransferase [Huintestinicola sp.]
MKRISSITPADASAMERARQQWNNVAKPLHSLGLLEEAVIKIAGITGSENVTLRNRTAVVMCGDNGVVCEGVTQCGSEVTALVAQEMAKGRSNINRMASPFSCGVLTVDAGMLTDVPGIISIKTDKGTGNIAAGPAMTREAAETIISRSMDIVGQLAERGCDIIVTGEMGIGNTTSSAAAASVLLDIPPERVTGRGAGLTSEGLAHKIETVKRAIAVNRPDRNDALDILAKVGGFDIAGIAGLFLGGAYYHVPVVIDGFISAVSAALAAGICPYAGDYMLCSHVSREPAGQMILDQLGMRPLITAEMCLGEGTGAVLLLPMLDAAIEVYSSAHKFDELPMQKYEELE